MKRVRELMSATVVSIPADATLGEVVDILQDKLVTGAPVVEPGGKVVGVISRSDVARYLAGSRQVAHVPSRVGALRAEDIMTPFTFRVTPDDDVATAIDEMLAAGIHRVLVMEGEAVVGVLSHTDIVRDYRRLIESRSALEE